MTFEKMINDTNDYYLSRGLAVIHKSLHPCKLSKLIILSEAVPRLSRPTAKHLLRTTREFTVGITLILKPKETRQKQSMPMKNFHAHQIEHMDQVLNQGRICFVLLHFSSLKETYLLPAPYLIEFYKIDKGGKSMPLDYIQKHGYLIEQNILPSIPYLDIISKIY